MPTTPEILTRVSDYVAELFRDQLPPALTYHNFEHTVEVVAATAEIGAGVGLSDEDQEVALLAAWLHDVGYVRVYQGHEEVGAEMARAFLLANGYPAEKAVAVERCILATRFPQHPQSVIESVVCDADLSHVGRKGFLDRADDLRQEWGTMLRTTYTDVDWMRNELRFLKEHAFHTRFAEERLGERKRANIEKVEKRLRKLESSVPVNGLPAADAAAEVKPATGGSAVGSGPQSDQAGDIGSNHGASRHSGRHNDDAEDTRKGADHGHDHDHEKTLSKGAKAIAREIHGILKEERELARQRKEEDHLRKAMEKDLKSVAKEKRPERGVETMFRLTSQNHMELSRMADDKANTLIQINTLIISIVLSVLVSKLDVNQYLLIPTVVLLASAVATIIFAVLATRPKISSGRFTPDDVRQRKVNLLFFGNFYNMSLDDYRAGMAELMSDHDYLYGTLTKDIYFLGQVLGRKYQLLRQGYTIFMYGIIFSVIAFVIAFIYNAQTVPVPPPGSAQPIF